MHGFIVYKNSIDSKCPASPMGVHHPVGRGLAPAVMFAPNARGSFLRTLPSSALGRDRGGTILRKGSPSDSPSFATVHIWGMIHVRVWRPSCVSAKASRGGTVGRGITRQMFRRWLLSHDVGVNPSANPMGRILVCAREVCDSGYQWVWHGWRSRLVLRSYKAAVMGRDP